MQQLPASPGAQRALGLVKLAHTIVWAFFAACIVAIPITSLLGAHSVAAGLCGMVLIEVAVLACNGMRCPLTAIAARYTADRRPNFDIFLPEWLARHNQVVFGTLYVAGAAFAFARWLRVPG